MGFDRGGVSKGGHRSWYLRGGDRFLLSWGCGAVCFFLISSAFL